MVTNTFSRVTGIFLLLIVAIIAFLLMATGVPAVSIPNPGTAPVPIKDPGVPYDKESWSEIPLSAHAATQHKTQAWYPERIASLWDTQGCQGQWHQYACPGANKIITACVPDDPGHLTLGLVVGRFLDGTIQVITGFSARVSYWVNPNGTPNERRCK